MWNRWRVIAPSSKMDREMCGGSVSSNFVVRSFDRQTMCVFAFLINPKFICFLSFVRPFAPIPPSDLHQFARSSGHSLRFSRLGLKPFCSRPTLFQTLCSRHTLFETHSVRELTSHFPSLSLSQSEIANHTNRPLAKRKFLYCRPLNSYFLLEPISILSIIRLYFPLLLRLINN